MTIPKNAVVRYIGSQAPNDRYIVKDHLDDGTYELQPTPGATGDVRTACAEDLIEVVEDSALAKLMSDLDATEITSIEEVRTFTLSMKNAPQVPYLGIHMLTPRLVTLTYRRESDIDPWKDAESIAIQGPYLPDEDDPSNYAWIQFGLAEPYNPPPWAVELAKRIKPAS